MHDPFLYTTQCELFLRLGISVEYYIGNDTEDESAGDGGYRDLAYGYAETADPGDENGCDYEEISVIAQIYLLDHLQTGNCDEAIEGYADSAHYAGRNSVDKSYEGSKEGNENRQDGGGDNSGNGSIAGDGHAANGFAVSSIGAASEDRANH